MEIKGWRYYKHAALPDVSPHEDVDISPIKNGSIWKMHKGIFLARWITDYDCSNETNWWYIVKDKPFNISSLKSKRRYEINKGKKNFQVTEINPREYKEAIYQIQKAAFESYPLKYRPTVNKEELFCEIEKWDYYKVYGAFSINSGDLCGYAILNKSGDYIYYAFHKVIPEHEKEGINAAIVAFVLDDHKDDLENGAYICDGSRSISHETKFQDYLEKYFDFRKAYCHLHIKYRFGVGAVVKMLYPFRSLLYKHDNSGLIHNVNAILKMEEIIRNKI